MKSYIAWEPKGALYAQFGACTATQLLDALNQIFTHPEFDRFRYLLLDLSGAAPADRCEGSLELLLAQALGAHYTNPHLTVYCVTQDPLLRHLGRMFQRDLQWQLYLVDSLKEARNSLAIRTVTAVAPPRPTA